MTERAGNRRRAHRQWVASHFAARNARPALSARQSKGERQRRRHTSPSGSRDSRQRFSKVLSDQVRPSRRRQRAQTPLQPRSSSNATPLQSRCREERAGALAQTRCGEGMRHIASLCSSAHTLLFFALQLASRQLLACAPSLEHIKVRARRQARHTADAFSGLSFLSKALSDSDARSLTRLGLAAPALSAGS